MCGPTRRARALEERKVKCLVWDLDQTLWEGVLLEGGGGRLRPGVLETLQTLDQRGILHSLASRNDSDLARRRLEEFGLWEYFLAPEIGWGAKSASMAAIARALNLGLDSLAFVDDQPYEREEVAFSHPEVLCLPASEIPRIPERAEFQPRLKTVDSARRRHLYRLDLERREEERHFPGPREDFLATLGMVFTLHPASEEDLERAEELTVRTHQLNTTGETFSLEELRGFCRSPGHLLLVGDLEDRFGPYGRIGLALVECGAQAWTLRLLLMSCRVLGRGVGTVMLHRLMEAAFARGLPLRAWFRPNGRNEMMRSTLRFAGFREAAREGELRILQVGPRAVPGPPAYLELRGGIPGAAG